MKCLNLADPKIKALADKFGNVTTMNILDRYPDRVPTVDEVANYSPFTNSVKYNLKAFSILVDPKSQVIIGKAIKNNWSLDKLGSELQIPKDQIALLKESDGTTLGEKLASFMADYSYTVEINTSEEDLSDNDFYEPFYSKAERAWAVELGYGDVKTFNTRQEAKDFVEQRNKTKSTQYYSNLTVPGGTNYTENEIATPAITPSIRGHAQFATDRGIGWFRSDEQTEGGELIEYDDDKNQRTIQESRGGVATKTRRILEVQSDLFQKGRTRETLVWNQRFANANISEQLLESYKDENKRKYLTPTEINRVEEFLSGDKTIKAELDKTNKENQFLQLLNKDNNWVTFFIKSIIQDSAKKGYEKVLFPTGNTASKVEGHSTLEEFKKQKEDRIKELEQEKLNVEIVKKGWFYKTKIDGFINNYNTEEQAKEGLKKSLENIDNEITQLKQELERVEREGFAALRPIFKFYENTVTNVLKKQGYSPAVITDEYGNTWNEVTIEPTVDSQSFAFALGSKDTPVQLTNPDLIKVQSYINQVVGREASVEHFNSILSNIDNRQITWGQVVGSTMYLANEVPVGIEYHEAFHLVFRNKFSNDEIVKARQLARGEIIADLKKQKLTLNGELEKFRNSHSSRKELSDEALRNLYYEEFLADEFMKWKKLKEEDRKKSIFARIFESLLRFLKLMSSPTLSTELDMLFRDIDSGYYANRTIQNNYYTSGRNTTEAYALIPVEIDSSGTVLTYEPALRTQEKVSILSALALTDYVNAKESNNPISLDDAFNSAVETLKLEYQIKQSNNLEKAKSLSAAARTDFLRELRLEENSLVNAEALANYKSMVMDRLRKIQNYEKDIFEEEDASTGDTSTVENDGLRFDIDWSTVGGFTKASAEYKEWIGTTIYTGKDKYGVSRTMAVNPKIVYSGILSATANFDPDSPARSILKSAILLAQKGRSEDIYMFIFGPGGLVQKTGLNVEALLSRDELIFDRTPSAERYLTLFISQNMKSDVTTEFVGVDSARGTMVVNENDEDVDKVQVGQWSIQFKTHILPELLKKSTANAYKTRLGLVLNALMFRTKSDTPAVEDVTLAINTVLNDLYKDGGDVLQELTGMALSPMFVEYLLVEYAIKTYGADRVSPEHLSLYDTYLSKVTSTTLPELVETLRLVLEKGYPAAVSKRASPYERLFSESALGEEVEENAAESVVTRASNIARDNYYFDVTVTPSTYRTKSGKTRYSLQFSTYNLQHAIRLRNPNYRESLKLDPFVGNTYLLNDPSFNAVAKGLAVRRVGSIGITRIANNNDAPTESNLDKQDRVEYKDLDGPSTLLFQMNAFVHAVPTRVRDAENKTSIILQARLFMNIMETSSTGELVLLPYKSFADNGTLTNAFVDNLTNEVVNEAERIRRVSLEYAEINAALKREETPSVEIVPGWNFPKDLKVRTEDAKSFEILPNGMNPFLFGAIFDTVEGGELLKKLRAGKELSSEDKAQLRELTRKFAEQEFDTFLQYLGEHAFINYKDGEVSPVETKYNKLDINYFSDKPSLNQETTITGGPGKLRTNLMKFWAWDYLNRISLNTIYYGDLAKLGNNPMDFVRRVKGSNGSGEPILSPLTTPDIKLICFDKEPTGPNKEDVMDAQTYWNGAALAAYLRTSGRVIPQRVYELLDLEDAGVRITDPKDLKLLKEYDAIDNAKKTHYFGGSPVVGMTTVKTSTVRLKRIDHSYKDPITNEWKPIPGHEFAHNLLNLLAVDYPVIIGPPSAFKTWTTNRVKLDDISSGRKVTLEKEDGMSGKAIHLKLQLKNPSNKTSIKDPSVATQILPSEITSEEGKRLSKELDNSLKVALAVRQLVKLAGMDTNAIIKNAGENLKNSGGTDVQLALLELKDGKRLFNPNIDIVSQVIEREIHTLYNNIFFPKIPGYKTTLESDVMHPVLTLEDGTIITTEQFQRDPGKYLAEGITSRNLQLQTKEINGRTVYYAEAKIAPHFRYQLESRGLINEDMEITFGLRIPTSEKHSMITIKIVDYLDASNGSQLILPSELIKIIGHDFDVDAFYLHRKAFYEEKGPDGKLSPIVYGTAATTPTEFLEFLESLNEEPHIMGFVFDRLRVHPEFTEYTERLKAANLELKDLRKQDEDSSDEYSATLMIRDEFKGRQKEIAQQVLLDVLKDIGLPYDVESFKKFKSKVAELSGVDNYQGSIVLPAIYNKQLELKSRIHSLKDFNTPLESGKTINQTPESIRDFTTIAKDIAQDTVGLSDHTIALLNEMGAPLSAKFQAGAKHLMFSGSTAIGLFVNANTVFSLFNRYGVEPIFREEGKSATPIKIGGVTYNSFGSTTTYTPGSTNYRIVDVFSTGTVAATDNWKALLITYFGLLESNLTKFNLLTARGVSPDLTLRLLALPAVKELTQENFGHSLETMSDKYKNSKRLISATLEKYKLKKAALAEKIRLDNPSVKLIDDAIDSSELLTIENLKVALSSTGLSNMEQYETLAIQVAALEFWDDAKLGQEAATFAKVASIVKLNKKQESEFEYSQKVLDNYDELFLDEKKRIYELDKLYESHFSKVSIALLEKMHVDSKDILIKQSPLIRQFRKHFMDTQFKPYQKNRDKVLKSLSRDLMTYLTIRAFKHSLASDEKGQKLLKYMNLSSILVTPKTEAEGKKNLVQTYRDVLFTGDGQKVRRNKANVFLRNLTADVKEIKKPDGTSVVSTVVRFLGGFSVMNKEFQGLLTDSAHEAFKLNEKEELLEKVLGYLIVKDGMQYTKGSPLNVLPPYIYRGISKALDNAESALSGTFKDTHFNEVFGMTIEEFFHGFLKTYVRDPYQIQRMSTVKDNEEVTVGFGDTNKKVRLVRRASAAIGELNKSGAVKFSSGPVKGDNRVSDAGLLTVDVYANIDVFDESKMIFTRDTKLTNEETQQDESGKITVSTNEQKNKIVKARADLLDMWRVQGRPLFQEITGKAEVIKKHLGSYNKKNRIFVGPHAFIIQESVSDEFGEKSSPKYILYTINTVDGKPAMYNKELGGYAGHSLTYVETVFLDKGPAKISFVSNNEAELEEYSRLVRTAKSIARQSRAASIMDAGIEDAMERGSYGEYDIGPEHVVSDDIGPENIVTEEQATNIDTFFEQTGSPDVPSATNHASDPEVTGQLQPEVTESKPSVGIQGVKLVTQEEIDNADVPDAIIDALENQESQEISDKMRVLSAKQSEKGKECPGGIS